MSSAGTVTTRPIRPCARSSDPGRANATTSARCGSASTSYQLGRSPGASTLRRAGGPGWVARLGGAARSEPVGLGIILPQVGAGFLELLHVADGAVAVH